MNAKNEMFGHLCLRRLVGLGTAIAMLRTVVCAEAVAFSSQPVFAPATNAPLAGLLQVDTDVDARVSVLVNDGTGTWRRDFFD